MRQQAGFSLLELLMVVTLLAIVLTVATTRLLDVAAVTNDPPAEPTKWEVAACRFNQNVVQNATEYFAVTYGKYPLQPHELFLRFLDRKPSCPVHGTPYLYGDFHLVVCPHHSR